MSNDIQCPSVQGQTALAHEGCGKAKCCWWNKRCTAADSVVENFGEGFGKAKTIPDCALASVCRWHIQAIKEGTQVCPVRKLGMTCEHQGGEWNTFDMAPIEEWIGDIV